MIDSKKRELKVDDDISLCCRKSAYKFPKLEMVQNNWPYYLDGLPKNQQTLKRWQGITRQPKTVPFNRKLDPPKQAPVSVVGPDNWIWHNPLLEAFN